MIDALSWLPVAAPLVGALLLAILGPAERGAQRVVALVAAGVAFATACIAWASHDPGLAGFQFETRLMGADAFGIALRLGYDRMSLPLVLLSGIVGVSAVLATDAAMERSKEHFALLLVSLAACNGAFLSINLFYFFFFCELATLPKFLLVARWWRKGADEVSPRPSVIAMQMTVYMLLGAMAFLAVLILLAASVPGSLDLDQLSKAAVVLDPELQTILYGVLVFALGIWSGLWPLHAWAPPAYATAQAPANMVFAGISKAFGLYGLLQIGRVVLPEGAAALSDLLFVLGSINILYAAWATMRQKDWNRLIAFASISHAGYTFIALSVGSEAAVAAAVTLMFGHGLITALGFLLTDELAYATGHSHIDKLGGLARNLPVLSVAFCVFAVAGSGFPGSVTFVGELLVFFAAWGSKTALGQAAAVVCVFGVILSATYLFRALHSTFFGPEREGLTLRPGAERFRVLPLTGAVLLVVASTAVGVWPRLITDLFLPAAGAEATAARSSAGSPGWPSAQKSSNDQLFAEVNP